ncbi:MAG: hypothetical protein AAF901_04145 [Bacteroidota bacterium]
MFPIKKTSKRIRVSALEDIVLKQIFLFGGDPSETPFISDILDNRNLAYDYNTLKKLITSLSRQGYLKKIPNRIKILVPEGFKYHTEDPLDMLDRCLDGAYGYINAYRLTKSGINYAEEKILGKSFVKIAAALRSARTKNSSV